MNPQKLLIGAIPALVWGEPSNRVFLYVHGKLSNKESAAPFAALAAARGWQTVSFDLPEHGERRGGAERCDIWTGMRELAQVGDHIFEHWTQASLFACSLGAFFSLHALGERPFEAALFQSPVVDLEYLIRQMFLWFSVDEAALREKGEIPTPIETLSWDYYVYVREHPITTWSIPTHILYGAGDELQSRDVIERFARHFSCRLTVAADSGHGFLEQSDAPLVERWAREAMD